MAAGFSRSAEKQGGWTSHDAGAASRDEERLARALGWFSISIGLVEAAAPRLLAKSIGVGHDETAHRLLRAFGLREMASGIGILLAGRRPAGWLWARVGGDAMDLALLGLALSSERSQRGRAAAATAAVVGVTALDVLCGMQLSRGPAARSGGEVRARHAVTINRPRREVYRFWRDFENLPRFMSRLEEVRAIGATRSHWRAKGPAGMTVEWDSEITEDLANEKIAWRSLDGADIENSGWVRFTPAPGGRGTEVRVEIRYAPPGGTIGHGMLQLLGESPSQQIREEMRTLKQILETGEAARSGASFGWPMHAAQPPAR